MHMTYRYPTLLILACTTLWLRAQRPELTLTYSAAYGQARPAWVGERGGPPANDLCDNAVVTPVPQNGTASVSGTNIGATDTEDFGNPNVWEAFSIDTCSTVTVSYCGTSPVHTAVYSILLNACGGFVSIANSGTSDCGDGNTIITYEDLAAGTYYVPVLLMSGVAEGPYTITFSADVCEFPPLNDACADAQPIPLVTDCALGTVPGNNAIAVQNGADPPCASSAGVIRDVWYTFNTGNNQEVTITLDPGTATDLGLQLLDACNGSTFLCASGDVDYTFPVGMGADVLVRVFSNTELGVGGNFTICAHTVPPPCAGGSISLIGGATSTSFCLGVADTLQLLANGAGAVAYTWVLANANDTVLAILEAPSLVTDTLQEGIYHVWGISHQADLDPLVGLPVDSATAGLGCLSLSGNRIVVEVHICEGVQGSDMGEVGPTVHGFEGGLEVRHPLGADVLRYILLDACGRVITRSATELNGLWGVRELRAGVYVVQWVSAARHGAVRVVVH